MENYNIISQIGKGNFGSIFKIIRKSDSKVMVWKELDYSHMSEKEKHQIVSEVNILRELKHPNIVRYYDRLIDKRNAKIYIVMEYCEGGDLSQMIKRLKKTDEYINEEVIWKIFSQMVLAIHFCHNKKEGKVLHRDIKSSNVFLDNENNIKLGDFGLSRVLSNESNFAYSRVGTPYYMSPEQIDEMKYNDKGDIWSLGCFLYELAAFRPPFEAKNHLGLAMKIKAGKVDRIHSRYSEELWKVISWMLTVDHHSRPSIEELLNLPQITFKIKEARLKESLGKIKHVEDNLKHKEEMLNDKERELYHREKTLKDKEEMLNEKEKALNKLIASLNNNSKQCHCYSNRCNSNSNSNTNSNSNHSNSNGNNVNLEDYDTNASMKILEENNTNDKQKHVKDMSKELEDHIPKYKPKAKTNRNINQRQAAYDTENIIINPKTSFKFDPSLYNDNDYSTMHSLKKVCSSNDFNIINSSNHIQKNKTAIKQHEAEVEQELELMQMNELNKYSYQKQDSSSNNNNGNSNTNAYNRNSKRSTTSKNLHRNESNKIIAKQSHRESYPNTNSNGNHLPSNPNPQSTKHIIRSNSLINTLIDNPNYNVNASNQINRRKAILISQ